MEKEKQIEEMARVLCGMARGCNRCMFNSDTCYEHKEAEALYNEGYRKQSEIAGEIFAEIEKAINALEYQTGYKRKTVPIQTMTDVVNWVLHEVVPKIIAELKKKYTEGQA